MKWYLLNILVMRLKNFSIFIMSMDWITNSNYNEVPKTWLKSLVCACHIFSTIWLLMVVTENIDNLARISSCTSWNDFFIRGPLFECRQLGWIYMKCWKCEQVMSRSTSLNLTGRCRIKLRVQTLRSGHVLMNRMTQLWQGCKKGYKSGNTNEDTATVASPLGHGPSALNRAMTILHSITSDLLTTWISGISCTISCSCTVKVFHTVPCHAR